MWKEYFDAHFHPGSHSLAERWGDSALYGLITVLFNGFPIPQTDAGAGESIRYMGELAEQGWSILIFPEGERSRTGEIGRFFPGVGMIASHLHLSVVPIRLSGTGRVLPHGAARPRRGPVEIRFGPPIHLQGESYPALARRVEEAVRSFKSHDNAMRKGLTTALESSFSTAGNVLLRFLCEANGLATLSREFAAFAERRQLPFCCVRAGAERRISCRGSVTVLELNRSRASFPLDKNLLLRSVAQPAPPLGYPTSPRVPSGTHSHHQPLRFWRARLLDIQVPGTPVGCVLAHKSA